MDVYLMTAILCIFLMIFVIVGLVVHIKKHNQLDRYWDVEIGMSEEEMLNIMGEGYNRSLLKNNRIKYEWRINASSFSSYNKGFSSRTYTGVKKVTIYTKNGIVEEVKPYNV